MALHSILKPLQRLASRRKSFQVPKNICTSSSSWFFNRISPYHYRSSHFTHSYRKFIHEMGDIWSWVQYGWLEWILMRKRSAAMPLLCPRRTKKKRGQRTFHPRIGSDWPCLTKGPLIPDGLMVLIGIMTGDTFWEQR